MNLKKKALNYFKLFSSKDLDGLINVFDQKILLKDWLVEKKGIKNVLKLNKTTFKKFKKISVKVEDIYINTKKKSVACKIIIKLDRVKLNVIDLIYFNKKNKISKLEAYKL